VTFLDRALALPYVDTTLRASSNINHIHDVGLGLSRSSVRHAELSHYSSQSVHNARRSGLKAIKIGEIFFYHIIFAILFKAFEQSESPKADHKVCTAISYSAISFKASRTFHNCISPISLTADSDFFVSYQSDPLSYSVDD
jgi:hypothetical protein